MNTVPMSGEFEQAAPVSEPKLPADVKAQILAALRDPNTLQCRGPMHEDRGDGKTAHCFMGLLEHIGVPLMVRNDLHHISAPMEMCKMLRSRGMQPTAMHAIVWANDYSDATFPEIADAIEQYL